LKSGRIENNQDINTIADGLRTNIGERNFYFLKKYCDGIILVEEEEIIEAIRYIWERMKVVGKKFLSYYFFIYFFLNFLF
jgi:threonine dehydratase